MHSDMCTDQERRNSMDFDIQRRLSSPMSIGLSTGSRSPQHSPVSVGSMCPSSPLSDGGYSVKSSLSPRSPVSSIGSSLDIESRTAQIPQHNVRTLNFSIDTILSPDFGSRRKSFERVRDYKITHDSNKPVDLSKVSKEKPKETKLPASGDVPENANPAGVWPAWVFCTRYSDRPSSGKFIIFITI